MALEPTTALSAGTTFEEKLLGGGASAATLAVSAFSIYQSDKLAEEQISILGEQHIESVNRIFATEASQRQQTFNQFNTGVAQSRQRLSSLLLLRESLGDIQSLRFNEQLIREAALRRGLNQTEINTQLARAREQRRHEVQVEGVREQQSSEETKTAITGASSAFTLGTYLGAGALASGGIALVALALLKNLPSISEKTEDIISDVKDSAKSAEKSIKRFFKKLF